MNVQDHSSMYASNRRYEALKTERDYWQRVAIAEQTESRKDGIVMGAIGMLAAIVVVAMISLLVLV